MLMYLPEFGKYQRKSNVISIFFSSWNACNERNPFPEYYHICQELFGKV